MAKDDHLQKVLNEIAEHSMGRLAFKAITSSKLSQDLGIGLARTTNPIYLFTVHRDSGSVTRFVAFTLALDATGRPATRAEAFGNSLALADGKLFEFNPFLLVYDYAGQRLMAVAGASLFGAFAEYAAKNHIPASDSASFSLSPSFHNSTISMYAEVRAPEVWAVSTSPEDLSEAKLVEFLDQVAAATVARKSEIPAIVSAIKARLGSSAGSPGISGSAGFAAVATGVESRRDSDTLDDTVQIEDRLWKMIVTAINASPATILVGPPGTGKSALVRKAVRTLDSMWRNVGKSPIKAPLWATPDESWTARDLIGGETVSRGELVFRPGWVLRSIAEGRWLILDEANRGDLDRIFGALLTWLSGGAVTVGVESTAADAKVIELGWCSGPSRVDNVVGTTGEPGITRYLAGDDWRMVGTYNALDSQRVFRLGAALGRRFVRVPVPPVTPILFEHALVAREPELPLTVKNKLCACYAAHFQEDASRLGPAQFLGMCSYIKSALDNVIHGKSVVTGVAPSAVVIASVEPTGATIVPAETSGLAGPDVSAASIAFCEAYVLNVGVQLAQMEEPDFEQLSLRLTSGGALAESELRWIREMLKALA